MDLAGWEGGQDPLAARPVAVSVAFEGGEEIAAARDVAQGFS